MKTLIFPPAKNKALLLFAPSICPFFLSIYDEESSSHEKPKPTSSLCSIPLLFFFFKQVFYLLIIFGCAGSSLLLGLSPVGASGGDSLVVVHVLLTIVASLVIQHGLYAGFRYPVGCGIFPDQGSNSGTLHWQVDF